MPTYTVLSSIGALTAEQKASIARGVTDTHSRVTGAQTFFAQVVFQDVPAGSWFMGGVPLATGQIYLHGHVRGGRPAEMKRDLILGMRDVLMGCTGLPKTQVWAYIIELPPALMLEYGYVLPEPGQESQWLADMPAEDRQLLENLGKDKVVTRP